MAASNTVSNSGSVSLRERKIWWSKATVDICIASGKRSSNDCDASPSKEVSRKATSVVETSTNLIGQRLENHTMNLYS